MTEENDHVAGGRSRSTKVRLALLAVCAAWPLALAVLWVASGKTVPTIHVRWVQGVTGAQRSATEGELSLVWHEARDPGTASYVLDDASVQNVQRIVGHPLVEDTAFVNRSSFVLENAPQAHTWAGDEFTTRWPSAFLYLSLIACLALGVDLLLRR
jgi:hypothetical protein